MFRTTIYLDDEIALAIRQLAETQKRSQADIIRDALRKYIKQKNHQGRPPLSGVGAYHSGRSDISEQAEELLKKSGKKNSMTLVADSGALYALYDADDAHHGKVRKVIDREGGAIIVPTVILAELDYLLREFLGVDAELDFLEGIASGA